MDRNPDAIVIGTGIGGAAVAALLASRDKKVTVLERNSFVGGRCASYRKEVFVVDVFVHMFGRCEKGPFGEILARAGRPDGIRWWHASPESRPVLIIGEEHFPHPDPSFSSREERAAVYRAYGLGDEALEQTIGFIGAGKMATALAKGFVRAGLFDPSQVTAGDPLPSARQSFGRMVGGRVVEGNIDVVKAAQNLVLAVKPTQAALVLEDIKGALTSQQILISIAAGLTLTRLETALEGAPRVIRAMPNTPALAGASATASALGKFAHAGDRELAQKLFSSVGLAIRVKESVLDAVTG